MTPANKSRCKKISDVNFKRMTDSRYRRLKDQAPELTHDEVESAVSEYLKSGGKIRKVSVSSFGTCGSGYIDVDNYLLGT